MCALLGRAQRGFWTVEARLLYSARTFDDLIYRNELMELGADVRFTLTREAPPDWEGHRGRIDQRLPRRDRLASGESAPQLRVRADHLRGGGGRGAGQGRA